MKTRKGKTNPILISNQKVCIRCKTHETVAPFKGHKCPHIGCDCLKCKDYEEKIRRKNVLAKKRKQEKNVDNGSTPETNALIKQLKAKSKKILNKSKSIQKSIESSKQKESKKRTKSSKQIVSSNAINVEDNQELLDLGSDDEESPQRIDSPPKLLRQQPIVHFIADDRNTSTTEVNGMNGANEEVESESLPAKSSASLCAQYLKSCGELSRKLSKTQWTSDEMIACFKYSLIRDCLGDVEMAAQKIAFASQEIRLGAAFMIQYPSDEDIPVQSSSTAGRSQSHPYVSNTANPPMLCSTFNINSRPNTAVNYIPNLTPIHRN